MTEELTENEFEVMKAIYDIIQSKGVLSIGEIKSRSVLIVELDDKNPTLNIVIWNIMKSLERKRYIETTKSGVNILCDYRTNRFIVRD